MKKLIQFFFILFSILLPLLISQTINFNAPIDININFGPGLITKHQAQS